MEGETVIAGVDTHKDVHVLCLLDGLGRKIWSGSFGADPEGYDRLAEAIGDPGSCMVVGVEGTASYGAGLTRRLVELGYNVVEVLRPKRDKVRPGEGKSDPLDAERAARKVDWQHLFGRFREGQPRFPELDRRHVAQRRVDPEVVVPVHVVRELGP